MKISLLSEVLPLILMTFHIYSQQKPGIQVVYACPSFPFKSKRLVFFAHEEMNV